MNDSVSLIIIAVCILFSAYFSATETAFSSLNRIRMKNMGERGNTRAALVLKLSQNFDSMLSSILIGNNVVNIACSSLATILFVNRLGENLGASVSTIVTTIVVLIFGEVSPKSIAKESPEKFAMLSAPFLNVLIVLLKPFNFFFVQWKRLLGMLIKPSGDTAITEEELLTIVEEAQKDGGIDAEEGTLIRSAIEFSDLTAMDVFTPRVDITALPACATREEIAGLFRDTGFSRLPVYSESIDNIVGVIHQKDFYNKPYALDEDCSSIMKPAIFITKNKKIDDLLKELQAQKSHMAIIIDEYGGTAGLITLEDILEELVGEIWDEHDEVICELEQVTDHEYLALGSASIGKVFHTLGIKEETPAASVNGWVINFLGRLPGEGEAFIFQNYNITIKKVSGRRIEQLYIKKLPE